MEWLVRPIGFVRSPYQEKIEAPRQGIAQGATGRIDVLPEYRDALRDLDGFSRIWVVFWFDRARGFRPTVLPPRSDDKRGVFATRSPHRPNPIGLSAVRLERIVDCEVHVADIDLLDGTPVLDIKPYLPYADAFPDESSGWIAPKDPLPDWNVAFEAAAEAMIAWIRERTSLDLRSRATSALRLGPQPHAYRRIRPRQDETSELAIKAWRLVFVVDESSRTVTVTRVESGFKPSELARGKSDDHVLHRDFVTRFPM